MGKKLIITEKPSVARDYAKVLNVSGRGNGFIENDSYVISWCYGHLVEMLYPESYDASLKKWRLEDLPFLPKDYLYGVIESAKEQYGVVNSLLHREDIDTVYWAGDSGKEGQTIEENIRHYGGVREGMTELRVWIDSQTDDEIKRGIAEAKPMEDYDLLGRSGIMRAIEDYALGINFSRALSVKYARLLNDAAATGSYTAIAVGRVMTCVLGMVVRREREIRNFNETPFYRVVGSFSEAGFPGEWKTTKESKYFESPLLYKENGFKKEESARGLIDEMTGKKALIESLESGVTKKRAPLLFNLAELQSECSKIFKISPKQTLDVIQELYEKKLTTYPRTDARVLTTAVAKEISRNINGVKKLAFAAPWAEEILSKKSYLGIEKTQYTDDKKVTDHYAVIPTGNTQAYGSLTDLQRSVYELIVKRFLAIFYPPAEYEYLKLTVKIDSERFFTSTKALLNPGYLLVAGIPKEKEGEDETVCSKEELLSFAKAAKIGDEILVKGFEIKEGKTQPPKRYTSGNLILAMENAGNLIEDEELRETIKGKGIGTSATRGEILEKLVRIKYLNQNPKNQVISPERLGEMVFEVVDKNVPSLLNPEMTANWEMGLEQIENGDIEDTVYRAKLEDYIRTQTNKMIQTDQTQLIAASIHSLTDKNSRGAATRVALGLKCPVCGGELTTTSFGYGCSNYTSKEHPCKFAVGEMAGRGLSEEEFKKLITEGKTEVLEGFRSKSGKPFKAALALTRNEEGILQAGFDFSAIPAEFVEDLLCPACGGRMVKTGFGYSCEHNTREDKTCYFSIGEIAGKSLDEETVRKLLTQGSTEAISGFVSKNKTPFKAKLKLVTGEDGKKNITFDFEGIEPDVVEEVKCPDCGGRIVVKSFGYGCENYKADDPASCKFAIGKIAQKSLTQANVKELLLNGATSTIRGFKGKSGKRFDAVLVLKTNEDGKHSVAFDFDNVEQKILKDVKCPMCGVGDVTKTAFGYGCSNYNKEDKEHSCSFSIGKICGVKLNDTQVKALITEGQTPVISGFKSTKTGKRFDAVLTFNKDEEGKISGLKFVFPEVPDKILEGVTCPKCGQPIIHGGRGYRCKNYAKEEGKCDFFLGKVAGLDIEEEQVRKLLKDRQTDLITGFLSRKGMYFDAMLVLKEDGSVGFAFPKDGQ